VAFDAPFGPTVAAFVPPIGGLFNVLNRTGERDAVETFANLLLGAFGYPSIGLDFTPVNARLLSGRYLSINTYGWTEFEIDGVTQCLTITTYGIDWYTADQLVADPEEIINRTPEVVSRFRVQPRLDRSLPDSPPPCFSTSPLCGAFGLLAILGLPLPLLSRKRRRSRQCERCGFFK
jgi:3-phytase